MGEYVFPFEKLDVWKMAVDLAEFVLDLLEGFPPNKKTTGSPIKGRVKRKNTSPCKKIDLFRLPLDGFVKSPNKQANNVLKLNSSGFLRIHQFPATARPCFTTCPHPLFHFYRLSVSRY
jgi:hypothetical protein